ncbi:MAG: hypothetical protein ACT4PV_09635 [Planctomycetaceae bacterium]
MSELEKEYAGRARFNVLLATGREEEIKRFELGSHGLVGFDAAGEAKVKLPGHNFGRDEIVAAIGKLLDERQPR